MNLVGTDVFAPSCISRFLSVEETAADEENVDNGQSDLEAEICEFRVDVVKESTAKFEVNKAGDG